MPGSGAEAADGPDTGPTADLRRNIAERIDASRKDIRSTAAAKPESRFMSNL
jgi:hypothetical protein